MLPLNRPLFCAVRVPCRHLPQGPGKSCAAAADQAPVHRFSGGAGLAVAPVGSMWEKNNWVDLASTKCYNKDTYIGIRQRDDCLPPTGCSQSPSIGVQPPLFNGDKGGAALRPVSVWPTAGSGESGHLPFLLVQGKGGQAP